MSQELLRKLRKRIETLTLERDAAIACAASEKRWADEAKEVIEGLLHQFAYDGPGPTLSTGGLSALEDGFALLDWQDPHPIPESRCDEPGCIERNTCGWPSPSGYRRTCSNHWIEAER